MDEKTISKYEMLEKLNLDEDRAWAIEKINYLENLFNELAKVDTEGIEPMINVLNMHDVLREDVAKKFITRDELLSNAPAEYDGYFQVPKTLE